MPEPSGARGGFRDRRAGHHVTPRDRTIRLTPLNGDMSLFGLLAAVVDDPALKQTIETARSGHDPNLDVVAPAALRPFLVDRKSVVKGTSAGGGCRDRCPCH